jgi:two-component system sensor histidine kinase CreC
MHIRTGIILSYILVVGVGFSFLIREIANGLEARYRESVEESLVDTATILAAFVAEQDRQGELGVGRLSRIFEEVSSRRLAASIYDMEKSMVDLRVYVTDKRGIVKFHSYQPEEMGKDYSRWNDVYLTLRGQYGARSTRDDPTHKTSSVLHVAAPIIIEGELAGVLTVAKPTVSTNAFVARATRNLIASGTIAGIAVVLAGLAVTYWLTRPLEKLTAHARAVRDGQRVRLPKLGPAREIEELGAAFEEMRDALEGKQYVERYVQTLIHELKSPVAAIQAAAELLQEDMPPERRRDFMSSIHTETRRMTQLFERLLLLAQVESRKGLQDIEELKLAKIAREAASSLEGSAGRKGIRLSLASDPEETTRVKGEAFLLRQAVSNLIQNALDFSPPGTTVHIDTRRAADQVRIAISDSGPGVPDYALERVFERFYSLPRPDTRAKSTGLGLSFVREVASLHQGMAGLENLPGGGARATLSIPATRLQSPE